MDFSGLCTIISIGLFGALAASSGIAAEFKRTKADQTIYSQGGCNLPGSPAFGLGFTGLVSLLIAQIITTTTAGCVCCMKDLYYFPSRKRLLASILHPFSWVCFAVAAFLFTAGAVMNQPQRTWFDGNCYVVKKGVFAAAGVLSILAATSDVAYYVAVTRCYREVNRFRPVVTSPGLPVAQPQQVFSEYDVYPPEPRPPQKGSLGAV